MKRVRVGTLMLLIVIAALCLALMEQHRQAASRQGELKDKIRQLEMSNFDLTDHFKDLRRAIDKQVRSSSGTDRVASDGK